MMIRKFLLGSLLGRFAAAEFDVTIETFRVDGYYPEGIAYDKENKRILLSSLISNTIVALDPANDMEATTYARPGDSPGGLGLKLDSAGHVHATLADFSAFDGGGYAVYDLPVGGGEATAVSAPLMFPCTEEDTKCGMGNDVVILSSGVAYVTDTNLGRVFKVEGGALELVSDDPLLQWVNEASPFGANGILYHDRGFLLVSNYDTGKLIKIDLETNAATEVVLDTELSYPDGMLFDTKGNLFVVNGGNSIVVLEENGDEWATANLVETIDVDNSADGETAATIAFGDTENEIFVTYVRFNDIFGGGVNEDPSLLVKVTYTEALPADEAPVVIPQLEATVESWRVAGLYPEGIAYDKANKRILLSSLTSNSIVALDPANDMEATTYVRPGDSSGGLGLKLDSAGHVHATLAEFPAFEGGGYAVYDLPVDGGEATAVSDPLMFPCTEGDSKCGMGNDVVILSSGVAYVTDTNMGRVFKVEGGTMELLSDDPLLQWVNEGSPFGANGILYHDRGFLLVTNYDTGKLIKIDLETNAATEVVLDTELSYPDGMLFDSTGRLFLVNGGNSIYVIEENGDDWASGNVVGATDVDNSADGETAATIAFGDTENEIFVTYVRFNDIFGGVTNEDPSLLVKVTYASEAPPEGEGETPEESVPSEGGEETPEESVPSEGEEETPEEIVPEGSSAMRKAFSSCVLIIVGVAAMIV